MGPEAEEKTQPREALKKLREARKPAIAATTARMKEQKKAMEAIKGELQKGEGTVPEIAAATGLDTWARDQAAPADQEITVIRQLISRIKGDLAELPDAERAQIGQAVTAVRKHRAVSLGMPAVRPSAPVEAIA